MKQKIHESTVWTDAAEIFYWAKKKGEIISLSGFAKHLESC